MAHITCKGSVPSCLLSGVRPTWHVLERILSCPRPRAVGELHFQLERHCPQCIQIYSPAHMENPTSLLAAWGRKTAEVSISSIPPVCCPWPGVRIRYAYIQISNILSFKCKASLERSLMHTPIFSMAVVFSFAVFPMQYRCTYTHPECSMKTLASTTSPFPM